MPPRPHRSAVPRLPAAATVIAAALVVLPLLVTAGCGRGKKAAAGAAQETPPAPVAPNIDYAAIRPNELGYIPVIMYHEIGGGKVGGGSDPTLVRPVATFKKDLELLYEAGFRPVNLADVLDNHIDVPAGTSPVVLTFDDGRESQFRLTETADALKVDPDCALGILQSFSKRHPDWRMRATFFVLPPSAKTTEVFGQAGLGPQKLRYLLDNGMEIGNHTLLHQNLSRMTPAQLQAEIGGAHNALLALVPDAKIKAVALPYGAFPKDKAHWRYLLQGTHEGKRYDYQAALDAEFQAILSPAAVGFDPNHLERVGARDDKWGVRWWIGELKASGRYPRYVSDGDPNVVSYPQDVASDADVARLKAANKLANAYAGAAGGGNKPIVGAMDGASGGDAAAAPSTDGGGAPAPAPKPIVGG